MRDELKQFDDQQYLAIETFRKNGRGVKTPVWFASEGTALHIWTLADSGKAQRIRRDGSVRVVPCTGSGEPLGDWLEAHATADDSPEAVKRVTRLFTKKYGVLFHLFRWSGILRRARSTTLTVHLGRSS